MLQACLLAIIAGYADTVGFIRYDAFAGLMTGNTILLGMEIATGKMVAAMFHGAIIVVFLAGVVASRVLLRFDIPVSVALSAASALMVLCGFLSHTAAALVLPLAMGIQNSAANRFNGVALNTVFITGNLQKLGEGIAAWLWPSSHPKAPRSDGVAIFALVWFTYAMGALLGALADSRLAYPLLLPAALLPFVMMNNDELVRVRVWLKDFQSRE